MKYETPDLLEVAAAESLILGSTSGADDSAEPPNNLQIVAEIGLDV